MKYLKDIKISFLTSVTKQSDFQARIGVLLGATIITSTIAIGC